MIVLSIVCNNCALVGATADSQLRPPRAHLLRADLRCKKWRNIRGVDWCPRCWDMLRKAKKLDAAGRFREETDDARTRRVVRESIGPEYE